MRQPLPIAAIESTVIRVPLLPRWRNDPALAGKEAVEFLIVRLRTASGHEGAGEASGTARWSGETAWGAKALVDRVLTPQLIGADATDIDEINRLMDRVCKHNWFTKAAIEMACYDAWGRCENRPVYDLLGGARRSLAIKNRFSLGACTPDRAAEVTAELVREGFAAFKVKVGGDPQDDIARVRAVRVAAGPQATLTIDATGGWSESVAIDCIRRLADCNLSMVEQPTIAGDFAAMAGVRRATMQPIIADDGCFTLIEVRELIRNACCDALSLYPGKNAGLRKAMAISVLAGQHGLRCTIGSNLEIDIGTAAMGHLVVAGENMVVEEVPGDMRGPAYYDVSIAKNPMVIRGPMTLVPSGPGLGIEVDWSAVSRLAYP
jgi:L-alanine-DL-glutamate epimerase-like enolase superfamily enzyme